MAIYIRGRLILLWNKHRDLFLEGNDAHPVGCDIPLQIVMAIQRSSNLKKSAPNGHYHLQRAVTTLPDHWAELLAEGRRALNAVRALWGLISRPILDLYWDSSNHVGVTTIETQDRSCMSLLNSSQNSTGYIQTGGFSPCTLFPDLLPPKPLADLLTLYSHITIKLRCLHT